MSDKTVLVVDDEEEIRISLEKYLIKHEYRVVTAANGKEAYKKYFEEKVDLIVSDIRMPVMDGIELLKIVKKGNKSVPFILITGFSEILETKNAYELGADGFLSKPFRLKEFIAIVKECLGEITYEPKDETVKYHGLKIEEFISGSKIDYPIFIKLSDDKFVRIAECGEDLESFRVATYKEKGVHELFLLESDHAKYIDFLKKLSKGLKETKLKISDQHKIEFMRVANNIIMENVFSKDFDREYFEESKEIFNTTLSVVHSMDNMLELVKLISNSSDELYSHSVSVAMLAIMLTKKLGWILEKNRTNIAMAGMFHDIGKKSMPRELLKKKFIELTYDEKMELDKHPIYGANMLMAAYKIPSEVIEVALQHHENCQGTGFPNKLSPLRIHPLAKIITIVNEFMILAEQYNEEEGGDEKFYVALKRLIILKYRSLNAEYFRTFIELFSFGKKLMREQGYE